MYLIDVICKLSNRFHLYSVSSITKMMQLKATMGHVDLGHDKCLICCASVFLLCSEALEEGFA